MVRRQHAKRRIVMPTPAVGSRTVEASAKRSFVGMIVVKGGVEKKRRLHSGADYISGRFCATQSLGVLGFFESSSFLNQEVMPEELSSFFGCLM